MEEFSFRLYDGLGDSSGESLDVSIISCGGIRLSFKPVCPYYSPFYPSVG